MTAPLTKYCPLCAIKHLARAKIRLGEARLGYPEEYVFALGEMSLAEDHLVSEQPALAAAIRQHRKQLESQPRFTPPFAALILTVAAQTGYSLVGVWRASVMQKFARLFSIWSVVLLTLGASVVWGDGMQISMPMLDQEARADIVVLEGSTSLWNQASADGISATSRVAVLEGVANATLLLDGSRAMTGDLNMGNHAITNVSTNSIVFQDGTVFNPAAVIALTNAKAQAEAAAIVATNAADQASGFSSSASGYAGDAYQYAEQASWSAGDAYQYAEQASWSAGDASYFSGEAFSSWQNAFSEAGNASFYAGQASGYADDASGYKDLAQAAAASAGTAGTNAAQNEMFSHTNDVNAHGGTLLVIATNVFSGYTNDLFNASTNAGAIAGAAAGTVSGSAAAADVSAALVPGLATQAMEGVLDYALSTVVIDPNSLVFTSAYTAVSSFYWAPTGFCQLVFSTSEWPAASCAVIRYDIYTEVGGTIESNPLSAFIGDTNFAAGARTTIFVDKPYGCTELRAERKW